MALSRREFPPHEHGRLRSIIHAMAGIAFAVRHEPHMRIHLAAATAVFSSAAALGLSVSEWRWLVLASALVLMAEAFNTAIEQACNAITSNFEPAIKAAKDVAAGAVLIAALFAVLIGASIFLPHILGALPLRPLFQGACRCASC